MQSCYPVQLTPALTIYQQDSYKHLIYLQKTVIDTDTDNGPKQTKNISLSIFIFSDILKNAGAGVHFSYLTLKSRFENGMKEKVDFHFIHPSSFVLQ